MNTDSSVPPLPSGRTPAVSVIIPTRDRMHLLGRTLASVLAQRDVIVQAIVVDDGSNDGTTASIEALDRSDIQVLRRETSHGVAAARNAGTAIADTEWVAWCDDDDRWAPDKLRTQLEALDAAPQARWAASSAVVVDLDDRVMGVERALRAGEAAEHLLQMNLVPAGGSGVLAERALYDEVRGFDERLAILADWDLWTRFALAADVAHVDRPHVAYLRHAGAMSRSLDDIDRELGLIRDRFAEARLERGVSLDEAGMLRWTTWQHVRARRTGPAVRGYLRMAARHRQPEAVVKALTVVVAPQVIRRRDVRPMIPDPAWIALDGSWYEDRSDVFSPDNMTRSG